MALFGLLRSKSPVLYLTPEPSSWFSKPLTHTSKLVKDLKTAHSKGDSTQVKALLAELNDENTREIFEPAGQGIDKKALGLFRELALSSDPEIKTAALKQIFEYADQNSHLLVEGSLPGRTAPRADSVLSNLHDYLNTGERTHLSSLADTLGYHLVDPKQGVKKTVDGHPSRSNNLLQILKQSAAGKVIHDLLLSSQFLAENRAILDTAFQGEKPDFSTQGPIARANLLDQTRQSIIGAWGSWASCNFQLPSLDGKSAPYSLDNLLQDACNDGVVVANDKFIKAYTEAIKRKETLRAQDPTGYAQEIRDIEVAQAKALKVIFDNNKMQARSPEGRALHQAIREDLEQRGAIMFFVELQRSAVGANEAAEIKGLQTEWEELFKSTIQVKNQDVTNIQGLRAAQAERLEVLNTTILQETNSLLGSGSSVCTTTHFADFQRAREALLANNNNQVEHYKTDAIALYTQYGMTPPTFTSIGEQTVASLHSFVLGQRPNNYTEFGNDFQVAIKRGSAIRFISGIENGRDLNSAEQLIRTVLQEDKSEVQKAYGSRNLDGNIHHLACNSRPEDQVAATFIAAQELINRIQASPAGSPANKTAAIALVNSQMLGNPTQGLKSNNTNYKDTVFTPGIQTRLLGLVVESIEDAARGKLGQEIVNFMQKALPNWDPTDVEPKFTKLIDYLGNNPETTIGLPTTIAEARRILGISRDGDDPYAFDETHWEGSLLDPRQDFGMKELFLDALRQFIEYLKAMKASK